MWELTERAAEGFRESLEPVLSNTQTYSVHEKGFYFAFLCGKHCSQQKLQARLPTLTGVATHIHKCKPPTLTGIATHIHKLTPCIDRYQLPTSIDVATQIYRGGHPHHLQGNCILLWPWKRPKSKANCKITLQTVAWIMLRVGYWPKEITLPNPNIRSRKAYPYSMGLAINRWLHLLCTFQGSPIWDYLT